MLDFANSAWTLSGSPNTITIDSAKYSYVNSSWIKEDNEIKYDNTNDVNTIPNTPPPPSGGIAKIVLKLDDVCDNERLQQYPQLPEPLQVIVIVKNNPSCTLQSQVLNASKLSNSIVGILFYSINLTVPSKFANVEYADFKSNLSTFYISYRAAESIIKSASYYNETDIFNKTQAYVGMFPLQKSIATALQITLISVLFTFLFSFAILGIPNVFYHLLFTHYFTVNYLCNNF